MIFIDATIVKDETASEDETDTVMKPVKSDLADPAGMLLFLNLGKPYAMLSSVRSFTTLLSETIGLILS